MDAPFMTADDFGMSRWWDADVQPGEPQTALSEGDRLFPVDLLDEVHLDSLDDARLRYARRMAADAVDHLIALMDAIDARTEDIEAVNEDGDILDDGEADNADAEPSLGAPENHPARSHTDMDDRLHISRARHPLGDQTNWACGDDRDREAEHDGRESEAGYDLACDDDELDGPSHPDDEDSIGWPEHVSQLRLAPTAWRASGDGDVTAPERHGKGFVRCGPDDHEDDDPGGSEDNGDHGIADMDGQAEQWPGSIAALPWSVGGYVA